MAYIVAALVLSVAIGAKYGAVCMFIVFAGTLGIMVVIEDAIACIIENRRK